MWQIKSTENWVHSKTHIVKGILHKKSIYCEINFFVDMSEFIWRFYVLHSEDHSVLRSYFYIFLKSDIDASHIWDIPLLIKESKKQRMPLKTSCSPNLCNFKHFWRQLWSTCSSYIYIDFFIQPSRTSSIFIFRAGQNHRLFVSMLGGRSFMW